MSVEAALLAGTGSLLNAGGQIAGGIIGSQGQMSPGDMIIPTYDPYLNPAFAAAQYDASNMLGFGNINSTTGPYGELVGRIQSANIDEKTKRRALVYLQNLQRQRAGQDLLGNGDPNFRKGRFEQVANRLGLTPDAIQSVFDREQQYQQQIQELNDRGLGQLNTDTIINRAKAAQAASGLAGAAAGLATTGGSDNPLLQDLLARDNRQLAYLRNQLGTMAALGGQNPAQAYATLTDRGLDQNLRVLEQALGASAALSGALQPGQAANANAGQMQLNAASIAAQQAQAANALRAQLADNKASSLANGIAGAAGAIGSDLTNYGILRGMNQGVFGPPQTAGGGFNVSNYSPYSVGLNPNASAGAGSIGGLDLGALFGGG